MKLQLLKDGKLYITIEAVGPGIGNDFIVIPKDLARGCEITAERFDDLFHECLKDERLHSRAYERAEEIHEQWFGERKYSDYDSFRISKAKRLNK